jgi:C-terminal processing protease CtpA/Prc
VRSPNAASEAKAANRAAKKEPKIQPNVKTTKTVEPAAVTPYDKKLTRKEVLSEIDNTFSNLYDTVSGYMPAAALAAFTTALDLTKKSVTDNWKA